MNSSVNRRTFLQGSVASMAATAFPLCFRQERTADALILIWIPGGMAATETFDPKPCVSFHAGMETRRVLTTSPSIETSIPGVRIAEGLERIAAILDHGTLIRSFVPGDLGAASHARYQQRWLELSASLGPQAWTRSTNFSTACGEAVNLLENGARSILAPFRFTPFADWDTHDDGHSRIKALKREIDWPVANLISELQHRGRLQRTLVVVASEFSRAPDVEGNSRIHKLSQYGLHAHFTGSASVLLFGGGAARGHVIGRTADVHPAVVVEDPVTFEQLRSRVAASLGHAELR